jgi:hypothetical protein
MEDQTMKRDPEVSEILRWAAVFMEREPYNTGMCNVVYLAGMQYGYYAHTIYNNPAKIAKDWLFKVFAKRNADREDYWFAPMGEQIPARMVALCLAADLWDDPAFQLDK